MEKSPVVQAAIQALQNQVVDLEKRTYGSFTKSSQLSPKPPQRIDQLAYQLASGSKNIRRESNSNQPMLSIFNRIWRQEPGIKTSKRYLPLIPLSLQHETIFAGTARDHQNYSTLFENIFTAASRDMQDQQTYLEGLLGAFQRNAWCIPAGSSQDLEDVSLFDHSRMTAALAACLVEFDPVDLESIAAGIASNNTAALEHPAILLVGGDFSGIQNFIYTISSKKAAKTLRGRSFYLQLLTEAVLRFILQGLGLPYSNVIYSGGGHFFLLAPLSAAEKLEDLQRQVTLRLNRHHGISLYMALGWTEVPFKGFQLGQFGQYWNEMHNRMVAAKQHRYTELNEDFYNVVFDPPKFGGDPSSTCSTCGGEHPGVVEDPSQEGDVGSRARICPLCSSFDQEIGSYLPSAKWIVLGFGEPKKTSKGTVRDALEEFGMTFWLPKQDQKRLGPAERAIIWELDDLDNNDLPQLTIPTASWRRYTVHQVPELDFDKLQKKVQGGLRTFGRLTSRCRRPWRIIQNWFLPSESVRKKAKRIR